MYRRRSAASDCPHPLKRGGHDPAMRARRTAVIQAAAWSDALEEPPVPRRVFGSLLALPGGPLAKAADERAHGSSRDLGSGSSRAASSS